MRKVVSLVGAVALAFSLAACGESVVAENGETVTVYDDMTDKDGNTLTPVVAEPVAVAVVDGLSDTVYRFKFRDGDRDVTCYSTSFSYKDKNLSCTPETTE